MSTPTAAHDAPPISEAPGTPVTTTLARSAPPPLLMIAAFASVYVLWGSTYLGIRIALESLPPLLMAGARFITAGAILFVFARVTTGERPRFVEWRSAAIVGSLLLMMGNGCVVLAEQRGVPSGLAALLVGGTPLWMTIIDAVRPNGVRPKPAVVAGLLAGMVGLAILVGPSALAALGASTSGGVDLLGAAMTITASLSWSIGSLYSRHAKLPASPLLATSMEMIAGGTLMTIAALLHGELAGFTVAAVTLRSFLAWAYLIVAGSLLGFTAYVWLLRHTTPAKAASYAYVNPVIAVLLGWALAGEVITARMVVAMAVIIGALVLITRAKSEAH